MSLQILFRITLTLLENEIKYEFKNRGADLITFVDISSLTYEQNKGYSTAILIGIVLTPDYLKKVTETNDYVKNMLLNNQINDDEFHLTELKTDRLADEMAHYLTSKGYSAYSQSEDNIYLTGFYNLKKNTTPLPHKTIALMAGLGWIGKHNLLVTPEYGSALSMCTVLTDAPLQTIYYSPMEPECGDCQICTQVCTPRAIKGKLWRSDIFRDERIDVSKCSPCLKCLAFCPYTQRYIKKMLSC